MLAEQLSPITDTGAPKMWERQWEDMENRAALFQHGVQNSGFGMEHVRWNTCIICGESIGGSLGIVKYCSSECRGWRGKERLEKTERLREARIRARAARQWFFLQSRFDVQALRERQRELRIMQYRMLHKPQSVIIGSAHHRAKLNEP